MTPASAAGAAAAEGATPTKAGDPSARQAALLVWLAAAAAIVVALTLQHGFGMAPCHLCRLERLPYYATLAVLPLAAALGRPRTGLLVAGLLLLGNAGLSAYHVGVEQGLIPLPQSCASVGEANSVDELRAQIMGAAPTCDQAAVAFLGLSLAAWNGLYAAALGVASLAAAGSGRRLRRASARP